MRKKSYIDEYAANTAVLEKIIGDVFCKRRKLLGANQDNIADRANVARATYAIIESGERLPRLDVYIRLCQVLYIDPRTIIEIYEGEL